MKTSTRRQSESGMAMMVAMMFVAVAALILGGVSMRLMQQRTTVERYHDYRMTFEGLEAAVASGRAELERGEDGKLGLDGWTPAYNSNTSVDLPGMTDSGVDPIKLNGVDDLRFIAFSVPWFGDGKDNNGNGQVDDAGERWMYTVYGKAGFSGVERSAEVVYSGGDVNIWRNAIFAGNGQAGGLINGNVSVHGSVHLLGNSLLAGTTAIAALDLSGTSLIHNNYTGIPASLSSRLPGLATTSFGGETIQTIDAKLRVKKGLVGVSGNSEIGEPNIVGNTVKETMDGTFVNDGWTGNKTIPDGDRGDPQSVWADNGWDELYDLGDKVPFPVLDDDWRDPITGAKQWNASTNDWYTHNDYFSEVLLAAPAVKTDGVYVGDMTINAGGQHFYWNATKNIKLTNALPAAAQAPAADDDYVLFNATTKVMTMNGQIKVQGNVTLKAQGNSKVINYSGRAAFLATGTTMVDVDLLSCNNGDKNNIANSFPVNNIIGMMSKGDMTLGSTAQCDMVGAFYSESKIKMMKQTRLGGTIVGSYFDMGTNVPDIYQVPTMADNLPLGMIGNYPIMSLSQVSWREAKL